MDISSLNFFAILVATLIIIASGSLWYGPKTFFPVWWESIRKNENHKPGGDNMKIVFAMVLLSSVIQAVAMALMVPAMGKLMTAGQPTAFSGALSGFMLWLGFIAPTYLVNKMFAGHGFKIWAIEVGNHLVNLILVGILFGVWH